MPALKKLSIAYKSTAIFGFIAFILSFMIGLFAGVTISIAIVRSVLMCAVFAGIGYGTVFIIKKYVPEFYEFINGAEGGRGIDVDIDKEDGMKPDNDVSDDSEEGQKSSIIAESDNDLNVPEDENVPDVEKDGGFREFTPDNFPKTTTRVDSDLESTLHFAEKRKMGKHIIINEEMAKYEPKLMAEAVRTMMKKDE